ncbi:MAG: HD domain-containing protein [Candidatus Pacebacteria bacterium]|nr:HD domain-containing protein [Candidatus Paceibacterota bacterium]
MMYTAEDIITYLPSPTQADRELITAAYEFAREAHEGHTRYSGEPYLSHLASVAKMLAEMGFGTRTISAGLLHDSIEDTGVTENEIRKLFGEEILFLVQGVTKLGSVRYYGSDRHNESLRKLFVATSQDIRVLIIKLVDRLHNMQTFAHVPAHKQKRIARETLEIYAPVAHRLGMGRIRKDLEDMAFPYVYPDEYKRVQEIITPLAKKADTDLEKIRKTIQRKLVEDGMRDFKTHTRIKGTYSLYHKLRRRDWDIDKIYDYLAIRVIVKNVEDCYQVLGIIHKFWRPMPNRLKDYIANKKPNGYQSIHTTVCIPTDTILEIQIRTDDMHREAEFGIASHMIYKEAQQGRGVSKASNKPWFTSLIPSLFRPFAWRTTLQAPREEEELFSERSPKEKIPHWIQEVAEAHKSTKAPHGFMEDLKNDFFSYRIFVFTPEGDVVDLPVDASPIDFAYAIHSEIGNHVSGARVNNKLVGLDTGLKNGDIVEILTKDSSRPTQKWMEYAKTTLAQRKIRASIEATAKSA